MILTCPACSTRFAVDDSALGPKGRRVRCGSCKHVWHQDPPEIEADEPFPTLFETAAVEDAPSAPAAAAVAEEAPPVRRARPRPPPAPEPARGHAGLAWAVLVLVLVVVVVGGWAFRDQVVQAWPNARRLYDVVGVPVAPTGAGLELQKVTWKRTQDGDVPVLLVEGDVTNVSHRVRTVPKIRGTLFGGGKPVQHWEFAPSQDKLLPGESVHFRTELKNPAAGAERLTMNFADP